jgi:hypothetical protein
MDQSKRVRFSGSSNKVMTRFWKLLTHDDPSMSNRLKHVHAATRHACFLVARVDGKPVAQREGDHGSALSMKTHVAAVAAPDAEKGASSDGSSVGNSFVRPRKSSAARAACKVTFDLCGYTGAMFLAKLSASGLQSRLRIAT